MYNYSNLRDEASLFNINEKDISKLIYKILKYMHKNLISFFDKKYLKIEDLSFNTKAYSIFQPAMIKTKRVYDKLLLQKYITTDIEIMVEELSRINELWDKVMGDILDIHLKFNEDEYYKKINKREIRDIRLPLEKSLGKLIENLENLAYLDTLMNSRHLSNMILTILCTLRKIFICMRMMDYDERHTDTFEEEIYNLNEYNPFRLI